MGTNRQVDTSSVPQPQRAARSGLAAALLVFGCLAPARAQSATGAIEGQVVDQSDAVLPGVTIAIRQPATALRRIVLTDATGVFRAPFMPVGVYELTATRAGFQPYTEVDVRLTIGGTVWLRLELHVAGVAQTVTVSATRPVLERGRTHASATVDRDAVQHLPVNGRNFIDFVLLTPGVARDVRAGDLSFAGQRGTLNSLVVDGTDNNNTFSGQPLGSGRAPYQFSQDAVQEFQVNANAFLAEYGRAGGGVINVVTRSGTNALAGSLFEFYRDKALNATNALVKRDGRPKSPYHYHQFGGTIGGPLRLNRDFFFFNYDGQRNTQSNEVSLGLPLSIPSDDATRAAVERLRGLADSWTRKLDQDVFFIKTDHHASAGHRLTIRYNHQDFTGLGYENVGPRSALEHSGDSLVRTRTLNASWSRVFGGRFHNELRMQYARDRRSGTANSDNPEAVIMQGGQVVLIVGRNSFSPRATTIDRAQVANTLNWMHGVHSLKAGVDVQLDRINNFFPGLFGGRYVFRSLASFQRGRPNGPGEFYLQNFAGLGTSGAYSRPDVREYSVFAQDEWRPRPDVTINAGVRYDLMTMAAPPVRNPDTELAAADIDTSRLNADTNDLGPRIGVAWSPQGRRYVLRGGWGLFYGRNPAIMRTTVHGTNGITVLSLMFTGSDVPTYPERFASVPAVGVPSSPNIFYVDRGFSSPRVMQANAAVEWVVARNMNLTLTYLFVDGRDLPRSIDRNLGSLGEQTFTIAESGQTVSYPLFSDDRRFRNFDRVIALEASAASRYNGMTVELNRRFEADAQLRVAYTLGKVVDTVPDATGVAPGIDDAKFASHPLDFEIDRATGDNDQRHRFVVSGIYATDRLTRELPRVSRALTGGWRLSTIVAAQSGQPYSARVGASDLNRDRNVRNDRAPGTRRNAFRLPAAVTVDARVARSVPLGGRLRAEIIWEAFNLLNRVNVNGVETTYYAVDLVTRTLTRNTIFGRPLSTTDERIMQLAARITF